jgi:hypothetical protein
MDCPNCGAPVPPKAKACPECGSDDETGWSEKAETDGLDLPDEEFNYDDFVSREFGKNEPKPRGISWLWWVVGIVLVLAILALMFFKR